MGGQLQRILENGAMLPGKLGLRLTSKQRGPVGLSFQKTPNRERGSYSQIQAQQKVSWFTKAKFKRPCLGCSYLFSVAPQSSI